MPDKMSAIYIRTVRKHSAGFDTATFGNTKHQEGQTDRYNRHSVTSNRSEAGSDSKGFTNVKCGDTEDGAKEDKSDNKRCEESRIDDRENQLDDKQWAAPQGTPILYVKSGQTDKEIPNDAETGRYSKTDHFHNQRQQRERNNALKNCKDPREAKEMTEEISDKNDHAEVTGGAGKGSNVGKTDRKEGVYGEDTYNPRTFDGKAGGDAVHLLGNSDKTLPHSGSHLAPPEQKQKSDADASQSRNLKMSQEAVKEEKKPGKKVNKWQSALKDSDENVGIKNFRQILEDFRQALQEERGKVPQNQPSTASTENGKDDGSKTNVCRDERFYNLRKKKREQRLSMDEKGGSLGSIGKKETVYEIRQRGMRKGSMGDDSLKSVNFANSEQGVTPLDEEVADGNNVNCTLKENGEQQHPGVKTETAEENTTSEPSTGKQERDRRNTGDAPVTDNTDAKDDSSKEEFSKVLQQEKEMTTSSGEINAANGLEDSEMKSKETAFPSTDDNTELRKVRNSEIASSSAPEAKTQNSEELSDTTRNDSISQPNTHSTAEPIVPTTDTEKQQVADRGSHTSSQTETVPDHHRQQVSGIPDIGSTKVIQDESQLSQEVRQNSPAQNNLDETKSAPKFGDDQTSNVNIEVDKDNEIDNQLHGQGMNPEEESIKKGASACKEDVSFQDEDRDTRDGGNNEAQAQARAEQRKKSEVQMQFGNEGLHIKTDNPNDNPNPPQPHEQWAQPQTLPPPQQLPQPYQLPQSQPSLLQPPPQQSIPAYDTQYGQYSGGGVGPSQGGVQYPSNLSGVQYPSNQSDVQYPSNQSGVQYPSNQSDVQYPSNQSGVQYPSNQSGVQYPSNQGGVHYPSNQSGVQYPSNQVGVQYHSNQGGAQYPGNPYPTTNVSELPVSHIQAIPQQKPQDGYMPNGVPNNGAVVPHGDIYSQITHDIIDDPNGLDLQNRHRRSGRDHTNYVLPPNLDPFKGEKGNQNSDNYGSAYTNPSDQLTLDGPPGLPILGNLENPDEEHTLKLVVVDKTDDEDDVTPVNDASLGPGFQSRSNSDVYPLDEKAIDRDMFKQVYDPNAEIARPSRKSSTHTLNGFVPLPKGFAVNETNPQVDQVVPQQAGPIATHPFAFSVTDYDSETALDTARSTVSQPQAPQQHFQQFQPHGDKPSTAPGPYGQIPLQYGQPLPQYSTSITGNSPPQQIYTVSQIDYERFVSNPSQLSTVRDLNALPTDNLPPVNHPAEKFRGVDNRTFLVHPVTNSTHSIRDAGTPQARDRGMGYKFQVNQYNMSRRASILNRAERLLDARRGQYTDRSDSSDELRRIDEDEEYDDDIEDIKGPRHQVLRHLRRRRVFDDSTSYNSSDDVLNTMRFHPRGPVSQAARRARLTSVNARLNKQKRIRAARRQGENEKEDEYFEKGLHEEDTEKAENSPQNTDFDDVKGIKRGSTKPRRSNITRNNAVSKSQTINSSQTNGVGRGKKLSAAGRGGRKGSFKNKVTSRDGGRTDPEGNTNSDASVSGEPVAFKGRDARRKVSSFDDGILPPPLISDDDINSSGSDVMEPPLSYRPQYHDESRYEESKLRDTTNNSNQQHKLQDIGSVAGPKGRRVMFFRNGDVHFKPRQVLINNRNYINLEKLLVDLSSMVETSTGVKHIFSWPEGREIKSITEFENGKYYVCSSINKLQRVDYGNSKEGHWKGGQIDRNENFLFQKDGKVQSPLRRPRVLTIISNMYRDSREKLILNTNSHMNFEDILNDIVNMVNIPNPPVRALYTERKPHQKVESYSQLIRDFAEDDNFIACGEEMVPLELASKYGVDGSVAAPKGRRYARSDGSRPRDASVSPNRSPEGTNVHDRNNIKQQAKVRRRKTDSVRVDINGKSREFFPPTLLDEDDDGGKPGKKLKLDWVYGFRGRDVKQNLVVLPSSGELVYFVAAVVVIYDKKFSTQKHYLGHSEEITCLAIHPNGRFVASGQTSGKTLDTGAHVRVWDGLTLSTYAVIGLGTFQQGIACVNFSEKDSHVMGGTDAASGELLMAIDDSDRHVLSVWEWQTEKMVARTTTTSEPVVSGCFYPFDETMLVTYGKEHIHFWRMFWEKGRKIMRDKLSGNFEDDVPKFVTAICFSPTGDVITGDSSGAILVWKRDNNSVFTVNEDSIIQTKRAHKKSVSALCMLGDGTLLSGGGNEVKAWDSINNYSLVKERVLPESAGHVRSIVPVSMGGLDGSIYVATTRNKVLEGSLQLKFKFVIQGHCEELWAVESHPLEQTFVSAGHDQSVVKWSAVSHVPVWRVNVENPCTSISIDPKGRLIAFGTTAGKVIILNSYNGIQLTSLLSGTSQVNALSFSPDGKLLAVGTFDGVIQIFYVQDEGHNFFRSQSSALKHNNMFIMHIDWSVDSKLIQAVLGDYDIVYWDVTSMQKVKAARTLRDCKWATHACPIGHSIIGPWQNLDRGDVINVVSRSQYRDLMVTGDTKGRLRLYKWPCSVPKAGYRQTKVYSSNVTCVTFTCDDSFVITSGGNDAALMQFSVLDPTNAR